jgi:apolipoprotein N-acyltransferase
MWQQGWKSRGARRAGCLFGVMLAAVVLGGGLRISAFPPASETVRLASLSAKKIATGPSEETWSRLIAKKATIGDLAGIRSWAKTVDKDLLERAQREARAGAKIVFWAEEDASVLKEDEPALLEEGSALAAKNRIYLGMALAVFRPGDAKVLENKLVMIDPSGRIAWQYEKTRPTPGEETAMMVTTDGRLRRVDTPFGRLSGVICFDADFPQTLAQAGAFDSAIVLNPASDWPAIDPWHAQMASFGAIEQGINIVHQASFGRSAAFDYEGNRLSAMDYFHSESLAMVSEVPTKGVRTIYSRWGDWFAWLSTAGLVALICTAVTRAMRNRFGKPNVDEPGKALNKASCDPMQ